MSLTAYQDEVAALDVRSEDGLSVVLDEGAPSAAPDAADTPRGLTLGETLRAQGDSVFYLPQTFEYYNMDLDETISDLMDCPIGVDLYHEPTGTEIECAYPYHVYLNGDQYLNLLAAVQGIGDSCAAIQYDVHYGSSSGSSSGSSGVVALSDSQWAAMCSQWEMTNGFMSVLLFLLLLCVVMVSALFGNRLWCAFSEGWRR